MVRKSLHNAEDFNEIVERLNFLTVNAKADWGKMNAAQMLSHCNKILKVANGELILPKINPFLKLIGIITKKEMWLLNNGIPPNMPTFDLVKVNNNCSFESCKTEILKSLEKFQIISQEGKLPEQHPLFGVMSHKDWGFLQFKHLNHHLKQFGL